MVSTPFNQHQRSRVERSRNSAEVYSLSGITLIAERRGYLEAPYVCAIEAKKDDFEQGAAQCLVEMQACQWINQQLGRESAIYGIVTNGEGWKFYRLQVDGAVSE